ncbi:MAG TPA: hypothetical protein VGF56_03820 [Rhizomicrobium sp.]|jgi:hypothetical protein
MTRWVKHAGALAFLAVALACAFYGVKYFVSLFELSDSSTKSAVIGAVAAVAIAAGTYIREGNKVRAEAHRAKKVEIYTRFINVLFGFFLGEKLKEMGAETDIPTDDATRNRVLLELKRT